MGNLVSLTAEEPDNRIAPTSTVESPWKELITALALGARPNQQHEPAARHNGAQRGPLQIQTERTSTPDI